MNKKSVIILLAMTFIMSNAAIAGAKEIPISILPVATPSIQPVIIPAISPVAIPSIQPVITPEIPPVTIPSIQPVIVPEIPQVVIPVPPEIDPIETTPEDGQVCAQVITVARNPETGEQREFSTPCDVPPGWVIIQSPEQPIEN